MFTLKRSGHFFIEYSPPLLPSPATVTQQSLAQHSGVFCNQIQITLFEDSVALPSFCLYFFPNTSDFFCTPSYWKRVKITIIIIIMMRKKTSPDSCFYPHLETSLTFSIWKCQQYIEGEESVEGRRSNFICSLVCASECTNRGAAIWP